MIFGHDRDWNKTSEAGTRMTEIPPVNQTLINCDSLWTPGRKAISDHVFDPLSSLSISRSSPSLLACSCDGGCPSMDGRVPPNICPCALSPLPRRIPQSHCRPAVFLCSSYCFNSHPTAAGFLQPSPVSSALMQQILSDLTL